MAIHYLALLLDLLIPYVKPQLFSVGSLMNQAYLDTQIGFKNTLDITALAGNAIYRFDPKDSMDIIPIHIRISTIARLSKFSESISEPLSFMARESTMVIGESEFD